MIQGLQFAKQLRFGNFVGCLVENGSHIPDHIELTVFPRIELHQASFSLELHDVGQCYHMKYSDISIDLELKMNLDRQGQDTDIHVSKLFQ